jgi:MFS family permease
VPLLAVVVDPHPFAVSVVVAADTLPWLLVALPAGAFADRFQRGPVMALANVLRAATILVMALLVLGDRISLALLILIVLVNAAGRAVYYSALQATVPSLVKSEALERANGVLIGTEVCAEQLAGPVVGTSLFAVSQPAPFFADVIALISSCLPFVRLPPRAAPPADSSGSIWDGGRLLFRDRRLRVLLLMIASLSLLQGMESGVLVLVATREWGIREGAYGIFLAVGAFGNLLGSVFAAGQVRRFGSARTIIGFAVVSGVGYLIMAAANSWVLAGPAFAIVGLAVALISVVTISLRQRLTPDHLMGRVGSAWRGIVWGAVPVGAIAAGGLATLGGLRLPFVVAGTLQCAVAALFARPLLRNGLDSDVAPPEPRVAVSSSLPVATERGRHRAGKGA